MRHIISETQKQVVDSFCENKLNEEELDALFAWEDQKYQDGILLGLWSGVAITTVALGVYVIYAICKSNKTKKQNSEKVES